MAKITYANKVFLNENADIPDENKVGDSDLNEIKEVVNKNDNNVGDLSSLNTINKNNVVEAINEVNKKDFIKVALTSNKSISAAEYTKVAFDSTVVSSDSMALQSDGGIVINNPRINYILVRANMRYNSSSTGNILATRTSKDINTNVDISNVPNSQCNQIISIIPVSQNDIIYIYTYSETNNTIVGGGNPAVWVSCEIMSL